MRIRSPLLINAAGRLVNVLMSSIFATVKKDIHFAVVNPYHSVGEQRYFFSVWHDSLPMAAFLGKHHRTVALASRHRDGSFVESIIAPLGINTVRGSTGRGGRQAARELMAAARDNDIVLVPDGPRGPRREMSRGIIYLSSRTGNGIVPAAFACDRYWEIKSSWTSHIIPRPFSRVVLVAGTPLYVPSDVNSDGLEEYQRVAQQAMDHVQGLADQRIQHFPGPDMDQSLPLPSSRKAA